MTTIIPRQLPNGRWVAYDSYKGMKLVPFAHSSVFAAGLHFEDSYETKEECQIAIHDYLEFGCDDCYSDKMRG